jgi:hypothetical protein
MKYIHFKVAGFVIFEGHLSHDAIAQRFAPDEAVSAGQCDERLNCYGESITLGVKSHVDDTRELIRAMRRIP